MYLLSILCITIFQKYIFIHALHNKIIQIFIFILPQNVLKVDSSALLFWIHNEYCEKNFLFLKKRIFANFCCYIKSSKGLNFLTLNSAIPKSFAIIRITTYIDFFRSYNAINKVYRSLIRFLNSSVKYNSLAKYTFPILCNQEEAKLWIKRFHGFSRNKLFSFNGSENNLTHCQ